MNTSPIPSSTDINANKEINTTMNNNDQTQNPTPKNKTQKTKSMKSKTPLTIRQKAIMKGKLSKQSIEDNLLQYETRIKACNVKLMNSDELKALKVSPDYQREEKVPHIVRLTRVILEKGEFLPPIIVATRKGETGSVDRFIVDGQQRCRASIEAGASQLVVEVPFESIKEEKDHFLGIQKGIPVNSSHIVAVSESNISSEILRINSDATHPAKGRIFLGKGRRAKNQIAAKAVENLVNRYGLKFEDLEGLLKMLMSAFEGRDILASAVTSAMLRGMVAFYDRHKDVIDPTDENAMTTLYGVLTKSEFFPRRGDNSKEGGEHCFKAIGREYFKRVKRIG